jgi:2-dehydropantoate 2-reductase
MDRRIVPAAPVLAVEVDVLWVTTKATQLEPARVGSARPCGLRDGGAASERHDHVALLQAGYRNVVAGAIRVESERLSPSRIRHSLPFFRVDLAGGEPIVAEQRNAGIDYHCRDDERFRGCQQEAFAVARAVGANLDEQGLRALVARVPAEMRSSMQKDVDAGRPPELDAIAGPIQRDGRRHGISVTNTDELARLVEARAS